MNDTSKNRLLLLLMAGLLLIGGVYMWSQRHKQPARLPVAGKANTPALKLAPKPGALSNLTNKASEPSKQPAQLPAATKQASADEGALKALQALSKPAATGPLPNSADKPPLSAPPDLSGKQPPAAACEPIRPTPRLEAAIAARLATGRNDPYQPIAEGFKPFPGNQSQANSPAASSKLKPELVPPPPVLPPPPPPAVSNAKTSEPEPAAEPIRKYSMSESLKLVAVIGDRAMLAFRDPAVAARNHWPTTLSLGVNEHFGDLNVVQVSADSVVLDEDGTRCVKNIQSIK